MIGPTVHFSSLLFVKGLLWLTGKMVSNGYVLADDVVADVLCS